MILKLFLGFFRIGLVGYGGGPASIPLVQKEYVDKYKMLTEAELIELVGICNMLPGPLITKVSAVVGYRNKGVIGAIVATFGLILPSTIAMILIFSLFFSSISTNERIGNMVAAVMPTVTIMTLILVLNFIKNAKDKFKNLELIFYVLFFIILLYVIKIDVIYAILGMILLSFFIPKKREAE